MFIRDLARATGLPRKTIRYYEAIGVLPAPARAVNGYRVYAPADIARLRFVASARSLGFSLRDITEILAFRDRGEAPCRYVLDLLERKAAEVERHIADLQALREDLVLLRRQAEGLPTDDVEGRSCVCHLIERNSASYVQRL